MALSPGNHAPRAGAGKAANPGLIFAGAYLAIDIRRGPV